MLRTEPSFCVYSTNEGVEEMIMGCEDFEGKGLVKKKRDGVSAFSFGESDMGLIDEEGKSLSEFKDLGFADEADDGDLEEYYERMIRENPSNSLFLRNYAQLLLSKGDSAKAENFYLRAALTDPKDGEVLAQYAKLVWELHQDRNKALKYFRRAAHAAPQDSQVLAAYASFLWDVDEDDEGISSSDDDSQVEEPGDRLDHCDTPLVEEKRPASPPLHLATGLGINSAGFEGVVGSADYVTAGYGIGDGISEENHYKRMIKENPYNPLILKNYARLCEFGVQTRGDLQIAEEYYCRAIQVNPTDGEVILQYAQLIWQIRCNRREATPYFKQAVEAAPGNSDVLAAYARFLWETEEGDDEDEEEQDIINRDNERAYGN